VAKYHFHLIRYIYDPMTGESIPIGLIVHSIEDSPTRAHVGITRDWTKVLSLDTEADLELFAALERDIEDNFNSGDRQLAALQPLFESSFGVQIAQPTEGVADDLGEEFEKLMRSHGFIGPPIT
jgi:Protein of unknown function (DUF3037)